MIGVEGWGWRCSFRVVWDGDGEEGEGENLQTYRHICKHTYIHTYLKTYMHI